METRPGTVERQQGDGDAYNDALFQSPGFAKRHWIEIQAVGRQTKRPAIGARIRIDMTASGGTKRRIHHIVNSGGGFGTNPLRQHIGLGSAGTIDRMEIYWPRSDQRQIFSGVAIDRRYRVTEEATGW